MQTAKSASQRITSIDILRGMTIAGMILVNNPGGDEVYAPLEHAEWLGLTPTDLVFPFFMFIMGMTTYLSLRKYSFEWSWPCARKVLKRALLLWGIGLGLSLLFMVCRGTADPLGHLRILGVLPRLGICYGLAAVIALSVRHKYIPWLIAVAFVAYYIVLLTCNGFAHDQSNIIAVIDNAVFGPDHVYRHESPDPEGLLSTLPALAHVLTGFCVGRVVMEMRDINDKIERLFVIGAVLTFAGLLLVYACPISKKLWTPTFAMTTCGMGSTLLALLTWLVDKKGRSGRATRFFEVFGCNPLALFVLSDLLLLPFSIWPLCGGDTVQHAVTSGILIPVAGAKGGSLLWAVLYVLVNWCVGLYMYKRKIYIKL